MSAQHVLVVTCLLFLGFGCDAPAQANQAVILSADAAGMEVGQGFLAQYADECRLILPTHVAQERAVNFRREGTQPVFGRFLAGQDLGDDVSVYAVEGISKRLCGESLSVLPRAVDKVLGAVSTAQLRFINGDGSPGNMAVSVVDNDLTNFLRVKPMVSGERISRGMSGSLLIADGTAVGMLLSVNSRTGVGTVIRQDALIRKAEHFLRLGAAAGQATHGQAGNQDVTGSLLKLVGWDSLPSTHVHAESLVSETDPGLWRTAYTGRPVTLDFEIRSSGAVWKGIRVDVQGVPASERPDVVELLMAPRKDSATWLSVKTTPLDYVDDVATVALAPRKGALLRLRFSRRDSAHVGQQLGIRRIKLLVP
jgi:hypothetical protein